MMVMVMMIELIHAVLACGYEFHDHVLARNGVVTAV
jgi:hypothetical protein